ncbi:MAG: histidine phosphatase family protein [Gemmatimonadaceae bacterium]
MILTRVVPSALVCRAAVLLVFAAATARAQAAMVILVRHADKAAAPAADPELTDAGRQRAQDLAAALRDAGVRTVITTQFARTRLTAEPLAASAGITPTAIAASRDVKAHAAEIAAAIRSRPGGDVVLVVGHSNTVPAIIAALGGPTIPDLCDSEYASLFVLQLSPSGARLVRGRYGAADAADPKCSPPRGMN